jgi:hypothetical protein
MSFSLTLAVHFYGTMVAGLFCVAMALGFFFRFFRKKYFWPIVGTCFLSVAIAVAPMAAAYAMGTPLQGSLDWGMSVMSGDSGETEETESGEEPAADRGSAETDSEEEPARTDSVQTDSVQTDSVQTDSVQTETGVKTKALEMIRDCIEENVVTYDNSYFVDSIFFSIALCFLLAAVYLVLREADQAGRLLTVGIFMIFMSVMLSAGAFGLPALMDPNRASIYFSYMLPVLWGSVLDGILVLPGRLLHRPRIYRGVALVLTAATVVCLVRADMVKRPLQIGALETNDAVTCLTNILRDHDDWTFTICSANDEYRMAEDYGYHYEIITFLRQMENIGRFAGITIPTKYTYFFVEKVPVDYTVSYENSGQAISEEGASRDLPYTSGLEPYEGESRWIVMSRMYYWAEAFMEMYPENMTVYYESDTFICYQLTQNVDHLFELGIDYGYNNLYQ